MSAALEAIEAELDVIEETLDTIVRVNVIKRFFSQKSTQFTVVALVAGGLGVATGWAVANKKLQTKYEIMLEEELEKSRVFLHETAARLNKEKEFADPEDMLESITPKGDEKVPTEVQGMKVDYTAMYQPDSEPTKDEDNEFLQTQPKPDGEVLEEAVFVERKEVFAEIPEEDQEVYAAHNEQRIVQSLPHVISAEEFNENETEWEQVTVTWFDGDNVLADEREQMVEDVEGLVGEVNMARFGFLSGDQNIVYIRNPDKEVELEVVHSDGEYAKEVLGFQHSDSTFERRQRRSRLGDDG